QFTLQILFSSPVLATTEIYPLSLHDALPISRPALRSGGLTRLPGRTGKAAHAAGSTRPSLHPIAPARWPQHLSMGIQPACRGDRDRKSTRLNSSHLVISYAVFCLKKKKTEDC